MKNLKFQACALTKHRGKSGVIDKHKTKLFSLLYSDEMKGLETLDTLLLTIELTKLFHKIVCKIIIVDIDHYQKVELVML